jgi:lysozyme family protein
MQENFDKALARVLVYEGGYANVPGDPGGPTMKGITQATYNSWRVRQGLTATPVRNIPDKDVATIYKTEYWDRLDADNLPPGVDFCLFDAAVNSGVGGATKWAQAVAGVNTDGDWGPKTETAVLGTDPEDFIEQFCSHRLGTLQRLPTWGKFGKGWAARIANVQKTALAWAQAGDEPEAVPVHTAGGNAKSRPQDVPQSKVSTAITHAGTLGGVIVTGAAQAGSALAPASDSFAWLKYVLGGLTLVGAVAGLIVYFSQQANRAASTAVRKATVDLEADTAILSVSGKTAPTPVQSVVQTPANPPAAQVPTPVPVVVPASEFTGEVTHHG